MTQTIRRKNCKTRREWADNKVSDAQRRNPKLSMVEIAGLVAETEHARAVRIVKREIRRGTVLGSLDNVLAALTKGRA